MRRLPLAVLGLVCLTFLTRLPALLHPRAIDDEAIYSVVANEIIDGGKPYLDAVERKPPLLFYTYAAVFRLAGKYNWYALHSVALLWTLATMAGLFFLGRRLFDVRTGLIAALLYSLFQPAISFKNIQLNGELLMNLPIVWAWVIAFSPGKSKTRPMLFLAGVLSCFGFLLKQPAAIAAVPLGLYLLSPSYRASRGLTRATSFLQFAIFNTGFWLTLGLAVVFLWRQGTLADAFYWTVRDHVSAHFFSGRLFRNTLIFCAAVLPLLLATACALRGFAWKNKRAEWLALIMLLLASAVGTSAGGRFYSHYYIQLLLPLSVLAAPVFGTIWFEKTRTKNLWLVQQVMAGVWFTLSAAVFPLVKWRELSGEVDTEAGRYLLFHHLPNERLFVWGRVPQIFLEAQMRPASRYLGNALLTGWIFGGPIPGLDTRDRVGPDVWENLQKDFARHPPDYIVEIQRRWGNYNLDYTISDFPDLNKWVQENYLPLAETAEGLIYKRRTPKSDILMPFLRPQ